MCQVIFLHTDSHGKELFRKVMTTKAYHKVSVEMLSLEEVVLSDSYDRKIFLIDLQTHKEWSTSLGPNPKQQKQ